MPAQQREASMHHQKALWLAYPQWVGFSCQMGPMLLKLNDVDPRAWLADVLARLPDHSEKRVAEFLPWNWQRQNPAAIAA